MAPIIPALPPAPPLVFILPLSCASLPLSFASLILYCPSFFLYICPISFPCLVLSSLLIPLSFEPAISSFICFLPSPLTASPLITWHVPSQSGSNHPSSPTCPTPLIYPSPLLRVSSSFLCLLSSTVPLSSCISVLFLFLALFFPLFWFLFHLNLLYLLHSFSPLPPDSLPSHHLACAILVAPIIPALPPAPPLLFILPLSCASLPISFVSYPLLSLFLPVYLSYFFSLPCSFLSSGSSFI